MSETDSEYFDEIKDKISVLPDIDRKSIESLLESMLYSNDEQNEITKNWISDLVETKYAAHLLKSKTPVMKFPSREESEDEKFVETGTVMSGDVKMHKFFLSRVNLSENVLIVGRAGTGKSTLILKFISELSNNDIFWIIFDVKDDYKNLVAMYNATSVIDWNQMSFNPFTNVPPGMPKELWWKIFLDICSHSTGLYTATPNHIIEHLKELDEEKNGNFTLQDVIDLLDSKYESSSKRDDYTATAKNRLKAINTTFDSVFNCPFGWDISKLFRSRVIIRTFPLLFEDSSILIQAILMWEFYRRLFSQERFNRKFTYDTSMNDYFTMVILDEAHHVMSRQELSSVSIEKSAPPMSTFVSMGREFGLSILGATQMSHLLLGAFKDNSGTMMIGNIPDYEQRQNLGSSLGMDIDDSKVLGKLQKGTWCCKVLGRTDAFVLKSPMMDKGGLVAEAEIISRSKPFIDKLESERRELESRMFLAHVDKKKATTPEVGKDAWLVLNHLLEHPWDFQKKITTSLDLSPERMKIAKSQLKSRGLVEFVRFKIEREELHFILTRKALMLLKSLGKNPSRIAFWNLFNQMPSYEHRYLQFLIYIGLKDLGYVARSEFKVSEKRRVDVYAEGEKRIAVEIEKSTSDVESKVSVLADGLVDELVLLYTDENHLEKIKSKIESLDVSDDKIWIGLARDYVKILRDMKRDRVSGSESTRNEDNQSSSVPEDDTDQNWDRNKGETK
ncbi:hypothetical protein C6990_05310 [Nitrosopumilus sp. b3]|uniref:ATP-binding protein n=1 Tax=Nitrosopumilus sp. b3 TaxID=2109909 RepID=UPI0015F753ED|nr:DUF87 domain-containing protein [Nitrosopumilus sp. b3]KAF6247099.1 hypothetical protein C6990_05310 [Nitrosopumilus sp. b3]